MTAFFRKLSTTDIRNIIAIMVVGLSFTFLFLLVFVAVPDKNQSVINTSTGLVLAALGGVVGYYFGASKSETDKKKTDDIH